MTPEWAGPDYGPNSEMGEVAPIVFDGNAEDATQRLHNRRPLADRRRIGILVRRARQQRNAGHTDDMNAALHQLALLGIRSLRPRPATDRLPFTRPELVLWALVVVFAVLLAVWGVWG